MQSQQPGLLNPNDLTAQSMIAGQNAFPLETNPTAPMTPATPELPPVATGPVSEEPPQPQLGVQPETTGTNAKPNPLPAEPKQDPFEPKVDTSDLDSLTLEGIVDPKLIAQLKADADPQEGSTWQQISRIIKGIGMNAMKPGSSIELDRMEADKKNNAIKALVELQSQLNLYKRAELTQRKQQATQDAGLRKEQFKQNAIAVRQAMNDAHDLGVIPPVPPTTTAMIGDPESVSSWLDQTNELIGRKRTTLDIINKQMPLWEKIAKSGVQDPKLVSKSFNDFLTGVGIDESEKVTKFGATSLMLESLAQQAKISNDVANKEKSARIANISSMMKERDVRQKRLNEAMASGDLQKTMTELRLLDNQKLHTMQQITQTQMQLTMMQGALASGKTDIGGIPISAQGVADLQASLQQLNALQADLENLQVYANTMATQKFNAQRPEIAFNDADLEAQKVLEQAWPEFAVAPDRKKFIKDHKNDPRVQAYLQAVANRVILGSTPGTGQAAVNQIDQQRMKNNRKDQLFGTYMQPSVDPNAGTSGTTGATGATGK